MKNCSRARALASVALAVGVLVAGVVAWVEVSLARPLGASPGVVWRESFRELLSVELTNAEAACVADRVGSVDGLVGPLLGAAPTEGAGSVWVAVDECVTAEHQGKIARAIVLGGGSAEEPAVAAVWRNADELLGGCVTDAGGWQALGSYEQLLATCAALVMGR